jgi:ribose transport system substrate-binding protein
MIPGRKTALIASMVFGGAVAFAGCGSSSSSSSTSATTSTVAATSTASSTNAAATSSSAASAQAALVAATKVTVPGGEVGAATYSTPAPGSGNGLKIGYISLSEAVPFVHLATLSIEKEVKASGATLEFCDSKEDGATALNCAKTFASEGVNGYLNFQSDSAASPAICAAGPKVPVIAIDIFQPPCQTAFMGADDTVAGELAGRALGTYFKDRFNCQYDAYISLNGFESGAVNTERMGGYDTGFSSICGPIHNERKIQADRIDQAQSAFTDVLTALPTAHRIIVVGLNDDGIEGALAAAKTQGRENQLFVSAQGADSSSWCDIKNNPQWIGDTAYFPERYGEIGVPYLIKLIKHQPVPKNLYTPHVIINQTNLSQYYNPTGC